MPQCCRVSCRDRFPHHRCTCHLHPTEPPLRSRHPRPHPRPLLDALGSQPKALHTRPPLSQSSLLFHGRTRGKRKLPGLAPNLSGTCGNVRSLIHGPGWGSNRHLHSNLSCCSGILNPRSHAGTPHKCLLLSPHKACRAVTKGLGLSSLTLPCPKVKVRRTLSTDPTAHHSPRLPHQLHEKKESSRNRTGKLTVTH